MDNCDTSHGWYEIDDADAVIAGHVLETLSQNASGTSDLPFLPPGTGVAALPRLFARWITEFPNEPIEVIRTIQVIVEQTGPQEFIASFREANIAMSGESVEDAMQKLSADILNAYEDFADEPPDMLGPGPRKQFAALRRYLRSR